MSLKSYREKRSFDRTPEPQGKRGGRNVALRFVVQKHEASHLHYDFRLEMDGVLKSWAVPKGPSLDPSDKRLAIQVEDHPLDYRTFEGTIPAGNYGAGTVMVWDEGTYEPAHADGTRKAGEAALLTALETGHLHFILHGAKLRGSFSLVRIKGGKGNNWLLIKGRDEFAGADDVLSQNRSSRSRRTMAQIAESEDGQENEKPKKRLATIARKSTRLLLGHAVKPMLATLVAEPFDRRDWLFEIKWDGYRAVAEIAGGNVKLYSRNQKPFEKKFAPIAEALAYFGHDAVLDGEIVVLDDQGKSQFELLQNYQKTGAGTLVYFVFDLLYLDGKDLRAHPLRERKKMLAPLLKKMANVRLSEHIEDRGIRFCQAAVEKGLEGIMAKDGASPYREGARGPAWLKIKTRQRQEAVIGGFTQPRGTRQGLGALVLGVYQGDRLVYVGHAGGGFNERSLADMHDRLAPLIQKTCPFDKKPRTNTPAQWVKPVLVCEVAFQEWTGEGSMRQPIFLGLREDKPARSVHRERPQPATVPRRSVRSAEPKSSGELPPGKFTNLDKIFWPEEGFTKGDVLGYYHDVAPLILPYLRDRPLSLLRHPNGIHGPSFFQKDTTKQPPPEWVQTARIRSESAGKEIEYLVCQGEETLLYVANLGCIEMNPWNSRLGSLAEPDYLILDLDPQDVPFTKVVETAQEIHKLLDAVGAPCCCKTSGKRGLHVLVPLGAKYGYEVVRTFAETIARAVHAKLPDSTSLIRQPSQRRQRVYLDFLQNSRGQTIAAPYSLRPIAGAPVSTPLSWREVNRRLDPAKFNLQTIRRRLDRVGDLWKPVLGKPANIKKCLEKLRV